MAVGTVCAPWPVELCCDVPEDTPEDQVQRWALVASQILWALSGRRWGPSCPVTVRPCRKACLDSYPLSFPAGVQSTGGWIPYLGADGQWRNASVCGCTSSCSCGELCEIRLDGPVYDILSIQDGEEVLVPEAYRVDSPNMLVRTDGECWVTCQDMAAPCGTPGTLCVTYRTGLPLDAAAIAAVSELTCHLLKGCTGGGGSCGCKANPHITKMTRQGVQWEKADPTLIYSEGRTGLPVADAWLFAVNPYRQASASRVYSPDFRRPRVVRQWP
ncbi:hypothetical protein ACFRQM_09195 [Streptomyces sp. NPDC056831]|uniref:hypothetical protein n=1 Tax=Streptomyces sp. NPDC056831 TaxID=3345954 RepID=UPI0036BD8B37